MGRVGSIRPGAKGASMQRLDQMGFKPENTAPDNMTVRAPTAPARTSVKNIRPVPVSVPRPIPEHIKCDSIEKSLVPENVPEGWKKTFEDARRNIEHAAGLAISLLDKVKPSGGSRPILCPIPRDLLAPFWAVSSPEQVRVIVVVPDPNSGIKRNEEGKIVPESVGLGPVGSEHDMSLIRAAIDQVRSENDEEAGTTSAMTDEEMNLQHWFKQGVLLLTMNMTTGSDLKKNPHDSIWLGVLQEVISTVRVSNKRVLIVLLGAAGVMRLELDATFIIVGPSLQNGDSSEIVRLLTRTMNKVNAALELRGENPISW